MIGIYCIENIINNKKYIGQSIDIKDRFAHHLSSLRHNRHDNSYLQNSWNKYLEENFVFYILIECEEEYLDYYERLFIKQFNTTEEKYGYNFEDGGNKNKHMSEESKKKMSKSKKGKYTGKNNPMYGIHLTISEERKNKMSVMMSGENNPMYGVHLHISEERKKEQSERMKGEGNPFYGKKTHRRN